MIRNRLNSLCNSIRFLEFYRPTCRLYSTDSGITKTSTPETKPKAGTNIPIQSSCLEGTKIKGLGIYKSSKDIYALEDAAYPEWLWKITQETIPKSSLEASSRQEKRCNSREAIKTKNFLKSMK